MSVTAATIETALNNDERPLLTVPATLLRTGAAGFTDTAVTMGRVLVAPDAERITVRATSVDTSDDSIYVQPTPADATRHGLNAYGRWVHQSYLAQPTPPAYHATPEESTMVSPTAAAVTAALAAQAEEHAAEIARLSETADGRVAAQRSNAAAAARITRDEEIGEALADMVTDGHLDDATAQTIADRLGIEIPEREYEVDVTITITQTIRVKASNAAAAAALAASDESFVQQSLQIGDGISIDGDDDLEVLDDGAGYSDPTVDVSNIQRV